VVRLIPELLSLEDLGLAFTAALAQHDTPFFQPVVGLAGRTTVSSLTEGGTTNRYGTKYMTPGGPCGTDDLTR
jgi:hypothetical protein